MLKTILIAASSLALVSVAGCEGSAEKTGENMDSAVEEATQGEENLGDGPFERAGESVDETTNNEANDDAADAVNDATDGNAATNP
jgi:hypothetical protein